jgi:hypothetical protein
MKRPSNTRTLTLREPLYLCHEREHGMVTLNPGDKVAVTWSAGIDFATAIYQRYDGRTMTSAIRGAEGPKQFRNWPATWTVAR